MYIIQCWVFTLKITAHFKIQIPLFLIGLAFAGFSIIAFSTGWDFYYFNDSLLFCLIAGAILAISMLIWFFYELYEENSATGR